MYFLFINLSLHGQELPLHSMLDTRMQRKIERVVLVKTEKYDQNFDNFRGNGDDYELEMVIGGRGNSPGQFLLPIDLTLIEGEIYVVDFGNQRIQVFDRRGNYQRNLELPEVNQPVQIRIFNNYIYVVDKKSSAEDKFLKRVKLDKSSDNLPDYLLQNSKKYKNWFAQ